MVDVILLIVLAGFVFYGLFFGLIRTIGSLAGLLAGVWGAVLLVGPVTGWAGSLFFGFSGAGKVITFFLLFTIINRLVAFGFAMLDRVFDLIAIIPFLKTINRLAGAAFGLLEGAIVISMIFYAFLTLPFLSGWLTNILSQSQIAPYLLKFLAVIQPILPAVFAQVKVLIKTGVINNY